VPRMERRCAVFWVDEASPKKLELQQALCKIRHISPSTDANPHQNFVRPLCNILPPCDLLNNKHTAQAETGYVEI
jgi:hypothetical protein